MVLLVAIAWLLQKKNKSHRVAVAVAVVMLCYVLVSGEPQAAELTVSTKLHLPQSLVTHLNSIISIII